MTIPRISGKDKLFKISLDTANNDVKLHLKRLLYFCSCIIDLVSLCWLQPADIFLKHFKNFAGLKKPKFDESIFALFFLSCFSSHSIVCPSTFCF